MNKTLIFQWLIGLPIAAVGLTACIDDSYDLANINTDAEFKVNELVVPLKLDAITLSNVLDLNDESVIKEVNGEYAVVIDGTFKSDPVNIKKLDVHPDPIAPIETSISLYSGMPATPSFPASTVAVAYEITPEKTSFNFTGHDIDGAIRELKSVKGDWDIDMEFSLIDSADDFQQLEFHHIVLTLPDGLHVTNYPCSGGKVDIGSFNVSTGKKATVTLHVDRIDLSKFPAGDFTFTPGRDGADDGTVVFRGNITVESGYIIGALRAGHNQPQTLDLIITPELNSIYVESISGKVNFDLSGFNVADVNLDNIPGMFSDGETDIVLANPQLYISMNNPVANYSLTATSGLTLTSYRHNEVANVCSLNQGSLISVAADHGVAGPYNFCLSPERPASFVEGYDPAEYVGFASLADILRGNGIPSLIKVDFIKPQVGPDDVTDFRVGTSIPSVTGHYKFFAPLELSVGSQIVYSETETGWNDDDEDGTLSKVTISSLTVSANVTNSLPVDIILSGTPLDREGKPCIDPATGQPVTLEGLTVAAGTTSAVELHSTGTIVNLDGIRYRAVCKVSRDGQVLAPADPITLTDIRVTVSGSYRDKL